MIQNPALLCKHERELEENSEKIRKMLDILPIIV